ncbi:phosphatidylinositol-binding protein scs2, partial [Coemansia sp. RSA 1285]
PGNSIEIQVILQPMKEDPPADFKCRDKFLIQSIQISPEMESMPMTELWAMVEREAKSSISEKKLRVRYLPPAAAEEEGGGASNSGASTPAAKEMATPASVAETLAKKTPRTSPPAARNLPGPSPLARSVETQGDDSSVNEASSAKSASPAPQQTQNQNQTQNQTQKMPEAPAAISDRLFPDSSAAQSPENTTTFAEAAAQAPSGDLQTANVTISALRQQLSDCQAQLERARGSGASGSKKQPSSLASTDGLSIQSVAIIALVAFLFGYFFF